MPFRMAWRVFWFGSWHSGWSASLWSVATMKDQLPVAAFNELVAQVLQRVADCRTPAGRSEFWPISSFISESTCFLKRFLGLSLALVWLLHGLFQNALCSFGRSMSSVSLWHNQLWRTCRIIGICLAMVPTNLQLLLPDSCIKHWMVLLMLCIASHSSCSFLLFSCTFHQSTEIVSQAPFRPIWPSRP